jgi:hypothetical protein
MLLWTHVGFTAITLGGTIYEAMVIDPAWSAAPPESLSVITGRPHAVNPARFWRGLGPWSALALLGAVIANWSLPGRRKWILISFACVLLNTLTFIFYLAPLLRMILASDGGRSSAELAALANRWLIGAWWRLALLIIAFATAVQALSISPSADARAEARE